MSNSVPELAVDNTEKSKAKERQLFAIFEKALDRCDNQSQNPITEMEDNEVLRLAAKLRAAWDVQSSMAICRHFFNLGEFKESEIRKAIKAARESLGTGDSKIKHASPEAWAEFFRVELNNPKRDAFTGKMMYLGPDGLWDSARNAKGWLKAAAHIRTVAKQNLFAQDQVMNMLEWTERHMPLEYCFEIPEWDGIDRIKTMTDCLRLTGVNDIGPKECEELVKDWCAKMFARMSDPMVRNRVLILKSPKQNIGKDWWIEALTKGLGQWQTDLTITRGDKDVMLQLCKKAVLNIAEFDKTQAWENSTMKDMVTKSQTDIRASYDADSKDRLPKASFISSCNVDDILRDHTGATRFIILEVESIEWTYPRDKDSKSQILGQCKVLADQSYRASEETEKRLARYLEERTPGDPIEEIVSEWNAEVKKWFDADGDVSAKIEARKRGWVENFYASDLLENISKKVGYTQHQMRRKLSAKGMMRKSDKIKGIIADIPDDNLEF